MLLVISPPHKHIICSYIFITSFAIRLVNPTGVDRPHKRQEEPEATLTGDRPNAKVKGLLQGKPREDDREPRNHPTL
jgi:hypothetical protein